MAPSNTPPGAILVIGASLDAERVVHMVRQLPDPPSILGLIATTPEEQVGTPVAGLPVLDTLENLGRYRERIVGAIPAAAEVEVRETVFATLEREGIPALPLVHPHSSIGHGTQVWPGAVVHANAVLDVGVRVGRGAVVGCGAVVGPRTRVGDYVDIGAGTIVGGGVRIGERARLGLGCRILDGVLVGPDAAVAPGSVVVADVVGQTMVAGSPAVLVRPTPHPELG